MKVLKKEDIVAKIKAAELKYYNESPCKHCGPGNGCDDCRDCKGAKKDIELSKILRAAYDEYEQTFGVSYQQDLDYDRIIKKEEEYNKWIDYCRKCGGNFDDNCRDCKDWNKKLEVVNSLKWLIGEYKRKYDKDYIMKTDKKDDFIISAEEARKMLQKEKEQDNKCLEPIMEKIKKAIKKKENHCYIGSMEDYVKKKILNLGYNIDYISGDTGDPRESSMYKISW